METIKNNSWLIVIGISVIAFSILVLQPRPQLPLNCYQKLVELNVVAQVANATGQLPGAIQDHSGVPFGSFADNPMLPPSGTHYSVNPDVCK